MIGDEQKKLRGEHGHLFRVLTNKRAVAPLLVLALLLCHGAFGAAHLISSCEACALSEAAGMHHPAAQQVVGDAGDPDTGEVPATGLGHTGYFAVVLAFIGVAVLRLLLGRARKSTVIAALWSCRSRYMPVAGSISWGPSPPLLQVFRL